MNSDKTISHYTFVAALLVALAIGLAIGFSVRGRAESVVRSRAMEKNESAKDYENKIRELESKVTDLESKTKSSPKPGAEQIYNAFVAASRGAAFQEMGLKALSMLDKLDESMTPYFIRQYRKSDVEKDKQTALVLAVLSGGDALTEFIKEELTGKTTLEERENLLELLSGVFSSVPLNPKRLHPDGELIEIAFKLLKSDDNTERMGAAGILASHDNVLTRTVLKSVADTDIDYIVRAAAVRSLGYVGDGETLVYLEHYKVPAEAEETEYLRHSLEFSVSELRQKFKK